jgi:hypothetical protein
LQARDAFYTGSENSLYPQILYKKRDRIRNTGFFKKRIMFTSRVVTFHSLSFSEVQRGNLKRAIELFNKAIPLANTELEMAHLFGLREAATAQISASTRLGIALPGLSMMD